MLLSYYVLHHLSAALHEKLTHFALTDCYSLDKEEIYFQFNQQQFSFTLKATTLPEGLLFSFPEHWEKPPHHQPRFRNAHHLTVKEVHQIPQDRSFELRFEGDRSLLFKLHGSRYNIALIENGKVTELLRKKLSQDWSLHPSALAKFPIQTAENFIATNGNLKSVFPAFDKLILHYLEVNNYQKLDLPGRWKLIQSTLHKMEDGKFHLHPLGISLLPAEPEGKVYTNILEACSEYFAGFIGSYTLTKEKNEALTRLDQSLSKALTFIKLNTSKLTELHEAIPYRQIADVLMAHLHEIKPGTTEIELMNFYTGQNIKIKLKKELSPQKNAENYYRKGKNQILETQHLEELIEAKKSECEQLNIHLSALKEVNDIRSLRKYIKQHQLAPKQIEALQALDPFKIVDFMGYRILIGRNAHNNDELTLKHARKDDLWLHAKDVSGSHVVIKTQAGKTTPKPVIEKAAQLAAWYSKRKNDSLCPVTVTPKKYIRKRKGDPAGAVVVEREEVVLVVPAPE